MDPCVVNSNNVLLHCLHTQWIHLKYMYHCMNFILLLSFGPLSEEAGDCLVLLSRAHATAGPSETIAVDYLHRAHSVYTQTLNQYHSKAIGCKVHVI